MDGNGNGNTDDEQKREDLREEHKQDPEGFEEKYGVDPDKPYEPVPGNPEN